MKIFTFTISLDFIYFLQSMTDGVSETVISSPVSKDDDSNPKCSIGDKPEATTKSPSEGKHFTIDVVNSEPPEEKPETSRPVMIFDFVSNEEVGSTIYVVKYVKSCSAVSCSPPNGLDIKFCQKLPKGTVPKQMKPFGVTTACCFVWRCTMTDSHVSTHYGVSQTPDLHIPFEYKGDKKDKLPKSLTVKDPDPVSRESKCPNVICAPPLKDAVCKIGKPSAIKLVKGSLRQKQKCCPVYICRRKNGPPITLYGRTSPQAYNKSNLKSILRRKPEPVVPKEKGHKRPVTKPQLMSSMKFGPHKSSKAKTTTPSSEPQESQTEEPSPEVTSKKPRAPKKPKTTKSPKPKAKKAKPLPEKKPPPQEQLAAMERDNAENLKRLQDDEDTEEPNPENDPNADSNSPIDSDPGGGCCTGQGQGFMVQRMQIGGMIMETSMPQAGGPPMPQQNMQLPGMSMSQYG